MTDTLTHTTVMTYDLLGRKTAMHDPDMGDWSYRYDPAGNLIRQTDNRGQVITFTYDALNRLTAKASSDQTLARHWYDQPAPGGTGGSLGRRTRMEDATGWTAWVYDARGRTASIWVGSDDEPTSGTWSLQVIQS